MIHEKQSLKGMLPVVQRSIEEESSNEVDLMCAKHCLRKNVSLVLGSSAMFWHLEASTLMSPAPWECSYWLIYCLLWPTLVLVCMLGLIAWSWVLLALTTLQQENSWPLIALLYTNPSKLMNEIQCQTHGHIIKGSFPQYSLQFENAASNWQILPNPLIT